MRQQVLLGKYIWLVEVLVEEDLVVARGSGVATNCVG